MSGQIDIGWSAPPFGLKELADGKIRIVANGNDAPSMRTQTVRVDMVNANVLKERKDALLRFVRAYRETLDWMFSSPDAVKIYAEQMNVPVELAVMTRGDGGCGAAEIPRPAARQRATRGVDPDSIAVVTPASRLNR